MLKVNLINWNANPTYVIIITKTNIPFLQIYVACGKKDYP